MTNQCFRERSWEREAPAPFHLERIVTLPFVGHDLHFVNPFPDESWITFHIRHFKAMCVPAQVYFLDAESASWI